MVPFGLNFYENVCPVYVNIHVGHMDVCSKCTLIRKLLQPLASIKDAHVDKNIFTLLNKKYFKA